MGGFYTLPELPYNYGDLAPYISEEQLRIHHQKHHQAYVTGANDLLKRLDEARKTDEKIDVKSLLKALSFNIGGHVLHSLYWRNLAPAGKGGGKPGGRLGDLLEKEFGGFDRFKWEFTQAALTVEGSGWAALTYCGLTDRPLIMQIEKHNLNIYPMFRILMVVDSFEHAYYIDYKNDRAKYLESLWNIINWDEVGRRLEELLR
ncbi:MAG: superoxide dismutase [Aigarchaeota archaeon]|nr:superoxide dismutase [Aigarchaeota archaeon]MDW8021427.1 superoxide dismutase [Nitrososphaerota archaeon]